MSLKGVCTSTMNNTTAVLATAPTCNQATSSLPRAIRASLALQWHQADHEQQHALACFRRPGQGSRSQVNDVQIRESTSAW